MAILKGFPPSNTSAPGVYIAEKDYSFNPAQQQSFHRAGLVGFASKGPINTPVLINSTRDLTNTFGYPHPQSGDPYLIYAAIQYLLVGSELYIVRVAEESAVDDERASLAEVDVPAAGSQVKIESATVGPYTFSVDSFFRFKLNGVLASTMPTVLAGTYTVSQLVNILNDQITPSIDGIQFYITNTNTLGVKTTFAYGPSASLELVSVQDAIYGGPLYNGINPQYTNISGLGTGMTFAYTIGDDDRYPNNGYQVSGTYDLTGLTNLNIQIVVDGSANTQVDNVVQVIDLVDLEGSSWTVSQIVTAINDQKVENGGNLPGGWEAYAVGDNLAFRTLHRGRDAKLLIKNASTAINIFGFDGFTKSGSTPSGVTDDVSIATYGYVTGNNNLSGESTFTITADSVGIDGNSTQVVIENNIREGNFNISVYNNGIQVESFGQLTKDQSSRFYIETYISLLSDWIRIVDNTSASAPPLDGTYSLTGGSDGIPSDPDKQDELIIGSQIGFTGLYALSEPEQIDIDLVACPGHSSTTVVTAMLDLCQNVRSDCMAIVDSPFGLTVSEVVQWQNGTHPLNTTRFDSDFGALYWPWVKLRDTYNAVDVWCPPSGSMMAVIARSDNLVAPWAAPAGLIRGVVPNITDVFSRPTAEEKALMYGNRNCVNPIVQFPDVDGFVVWGQKTLQRRPTALDRINVRRTMFYIEKQIRSQGRTLLFEPNDEQLRQQFIRIATSILTQVQVGRGIYAFKIQCDADLNTPDVIDRNELRAKIGVQPTKAVEFIYVEFSLHRTGSFTENADSIF